MAELPRPRRGRLWTTLVLALASAFGLWALLAPLARPAPPPADPGASLDAVRSAEAPLLFLVLFGLCLAAIVVSLETRRLDSRWVALLGVLLGINAVLRLVPGWPGFSAAFLLPILAGYVLGADFGFLLGTLSLVVSGVITGGMGPWLPFQMLGFGWIGLASGWLPQLARRQRLEIAMLAAWGVVAGYLYGPVTNLWFWPYLAAEAGTGASWSPGAGLVENLARVGLYSVASSLLWDVGRAVGNLVLILLAGPAVLRLLRRFARRFRFVVEDGY